MLWIGWKYQPTWNSLFGPALSYGERISMSDRVEFPKTLPPEMGRWKAGRISKTLILSLRPDGSRTTQRDPTARFGVYEWTGKNWEWKGTYNSRREARLAAKHIRKK